MVVDDSSEDEEVLFNITSTTKKLVITDSEDEAEKVAGTQSEDAHEDENAPVPNCGAG